MACKTIVKSGPRAACEAGEVNERHREQAIGAIGNYRRAQVARDGIVVVDQPGEKFRVQASACCWRVSHLKVEL